MSPDWIAVDWGTTNLRAWLMSRDGTVKSTCRSDLGMSRLTPDEFEPALLDLLGEILRPDTVTPVIVCGMAGARQGWLEAPYMPVPCGPPGFDKAVSPAMNDGRLKAYILPGLMQTDPADVMRGEETQIAGYLADHPDFDGVICLPGTHTKWVRVADTTITGFHTFMTGEIFGLLSSQSVLRHSVGGTGSDQKAFGQAVKTALEDPTKVASSLFSIRAQALVKNICEATLRSELSGYLLGLELGSVRQHWRDLETVLIGDTRLVKLYQTGLEALGINAITVDSEDITLRGLRRAYAKLLT